MSPVREPAVRARSSRRGGLRHVVVPFMTPGPRSRISPSSILTSVCGGVQPTVPNRWRSAGSARRRRVSGQAVALQHRDADGVEPLRDLPVRAAEPEMKNCNRPPKRSHLRSRAPACRPLPGQRWRHPLASLVLAARHRGQGLRWPNPKGSSTPPSLAHRRFDPAVHLLEDARHGLRIGLDDREVLRRSCPPGRRRR